MLARSSFLMGGGLALVFFFGIGTLLYLGGFSSYSQFRKLENLPRIAIRAVPMGIVEIQGKASTETTLSSPVSHTPCCAYRPRIDSYTPQPGDRPAKQEALLQVEEGKFYLEDETGRVLVDLRNLEFDQTVWARTVNLNPKAGVPALDRHFSGPALGASDDELRAYARKLVPHCRAPYAELFEYLIVAGPIYSLTGTCAENPQATGEADRKIIMKGQNDPTFRIAARTREQEINRLRRRAHIFIGLGAALAILGILMASAFILGAGVLEK